MAFYSPSESQFTRLYREEVEIAFSAIDCVLNRERAVYASTELTSGERLNNALRASGLASASALRHSKGQEWYTTNIWDRNVQAALAFAERTRAAIGDGTLVITPAPFSAPGWTQPEYLAFWETLLRTRIKAAWFNTGWQFSNGCTFEFAVAYDAGIPTFDKDGQHLSLDVAIRLIQDAIEGLSAEGIDTSKLRESLARLPGKVASSR
jgi:hypothetical protein